MRRILFLILVFLLVLCAACSDSALDNAEKELQDSVLDLESADNKYVLMVQNGYRTDNPDLTYVDAFEDFFATPRWKYFEGEEGQDVVEFTGDCIYQDVTVKARIQFVVDEENETFEATYLAFNEVPQDMLTLGTLMNKVFETDPSEGSPVGENPGGEEPNEGAPDGENSEDGDVTPQTGDDPDEPSEQPTNAEPEPIPDLKEYFTAGKDPFDLLENDTVADSLKRLMGNDYAYFTECLQSVETSYYDEDNAYIIKGGVPGLYTIMEAIVQINQNGDVYAAFLEDDHVAYYTTDDPSMLSIGNSWIYDWIWDYMGRPIRVNNTVSDTKIGGTYESEDGNAFFEMTAKDGKLQFSGFASYGANIGDVSDSVKLTDGFAVYKQDDSSLYFHFSGDTLLVFEDGMFGGMGVTFAGVYCKG